MLRTAECMSDASGEGDGGATVTTCIDVAIHGRATVRWTDTTTSACSSRDAQRMLLSHLFII